MAILRTFNFLLLATANISDGAGLIDLEDNSQSDYNLDQSDWEGVSNFAMVPEPPLLDTFEISIPLVKIGITVGDFIGIGFRTEYVPCIYGCWPRDAVESPVTWGTAKLMPWRKNQINWRLVKS